MAKKHTYEKVRGVFEREKGTNIWWVEYWPDGKRRLKKVGSHEDAVNEKTRLEAAKLTKKITPKVVVLAPVKFKELCDDIQVLKRKTAKVQKRI